MFDMPAISALAHSFGDRDRASLLAAGVWTDDPAALGILAVVHGGKLQELVIPDSYLQLKPIELADIINAVIVNAFLDWNTSRGDLLYAAGS